MGGVYLPDVGSAPSYKEAMVLWFAFDLHSVLQLGLRERGRAGERRERGRGEMERCVTCVRQVCEQVYIERERGCERYMHIM